MKMKRIKAHATTSDRKDGDGSDERIRVGDPYLARCESKLDVKGRERDGRERVPKGAEEV